MCYIKIAEKKIILGLSFASEGNFGMILSFHATILCIFEQYFESDLKNTISQVETFLNLQKIPGNGEFLPIHTHLFAPVINGGLVLLVPVC